MNGAVRVALIFFSALRIQRLLLWIGGAVILVGYLLPAPGKIVVIVIGFAVPLVPSAFLGSILLRHLVMPRMMQLIPHGRAQVLGGMALAAGTVATVATLIGWSFGAPPVAFWLLAATIASLVLLTQFPLTSSVPGTVIWWVVLSGFSQGIRDPDARELIAGIAGSKATLTAILAIAWAVFGIWFMRVKTFKPPGKAGQHGKRIFKVDPSHATAIRTFLMGNPSVFNMFSAGIAGVIVIAATWTVMRHFVGAGESFTRSAASGMAAAQSLGIYTGAGGILVVLRSKFLWLRGSVDREGLFRLCERQAWVCYGASAVSVLLLLALMALVDWTHIAKYSVMMCFHLSVGACGLYLGLMHVRGWRALDVLFTIGLLVGWGTTNAFLLGDGRPPALLALVFAVTAAIGIAFRLIALHRWRNIDWLVCRLPRSLQQMRST